MYRLNGYSYPVIAHKALTPANQRTRKSTLRRRAIAKQTVRTEQYAAAARNLSWFAPVSNGLKATEFKGPIVEGAYYERYCGRIAGPMTPALMGVYAALPATELTRRAYITHTDPAEVVAELRDLIRCATSDPFSTDKRYDQGVATGYEKSANLVAEKLVVKS